MKRILFLLGLMVTMVFMTGFLGCDLTSFLERSCYTNSLNTYVDCMEDLGDCLVLIGDGNYCHEKSLECLKEWIDELSDCAVEHGCLEKYINCFDDMLNEGYYTPPLCGYILDNCADWYDEDCENDCFADIMECYSYEDYDKCSEEYGECVLACWK